jgi:hypothetical protein
MVEFPNLYTYADAGNEFKGSCNSLFKKYNIRLINTKSIHKASIIERFNRTFKSKIERYLTAKKSKKYIDALPDFVSSYNKSIHSAIKCAPNQVTKKNVHIIKERLYGPVNHPYLVNFEFKIGDYVRVVEDKKIFNKGYTQNWSSDIYVVSMLFPTIPPTYKIKSIEGNKITCSFSVREKIIILKFLNST